MHKCGRDIEFTVIFAGIGSQIKIDAAGLAVGAEGTGPYVGFAVEPSPEDVETVKVKLFPELNALLSQG